MSVARYAANAREVRAPRGTEISAKSWLTEAPLRMLMNNLDPDVAENPEQLVVYGGIGRAARDWDCFDAIVEALRALEGDETLLVQSGKPVGVLRTHADAPRVLIANSNLVPHWATWAHFNELDAKGLMMYGQMTAGSWIYIGSQGIVQGTYETFVEAGRRHYGGDLSGKWILTAGLGGMGGAQPLAATMAGASMLAVECRPSHLQRRIDSGYLDRRAEGLDEALAIIRDACARGEAVSVGVVGNAAEMVPELVARGVRPDLVTDQTAAHDPVNGYLPLDWTLEKWDEMRETDPDAVAAAAKASMARHVEAMLTFHRDGVPTFDYGNNIRQVALDEGVADAFAFPGFVPAYIRPLFCRGVGPFRWAALSGDPEDIFRTDAKVKELIPDDAHLHNWLDMARERIQFQGLPRLQRDGGQGRAVGARGDRPRPSRFRLGRQPQPRDRGHEGRQRCGVRLAAPERPGQHRERRHLGVVPPRRRRRHGLLAACRHGRRLRRQRGRRTADRARAVERPGDRRPAPRRRRLRGGPRLRPRAGAQTADGGGVVGWPAIPMIFSPIMFSSTCRTGRPRVISRMPGLRRQSQTY